MKTALIGLAGLALGVTLSFAACGDDDDDGTQPAAGKGGSAGASGAGTAGASGAGSAGSSTAGASGAGDGGAGGSAGGAGGGASGAGGAGPTSFSKEVLPRLSACSGDCHDTSSTSPGGGLVFSYDAFLDDSVPTNCPDLPAYVDTESPERSLLWVKLAPEPALGRACGGKMPFGSAGDQALADVVLRWITEGAEPLARARKSSTARTGRASARATHPLNHGSGRPFRAKAVIEFVGASMGARLSGAVVAIYHSKRDPSDDEWGYFLAAMGRVRGQLAQARAVIFSEGGTPSVAQRDRLAKEIGWRPTVTSVIADSIMPRAAANAAALANRHVRAFVSSELELALVHVDATVAERAFVLESRDRLRLRVGTPF